MPLTEREQVNLQGLGPLIEALSIPATAISTPDGGRWLARGIPQALGFAWENDTSATFTLVLSTGTGTGSAAGGVRLVVPPYSNGSVPGCFGAASIDPKAPQANGGAGTVEWYWTGFVPPFAVRGLSPGATGDTGQDNSLTVPAGWPVLFDVKAFRDCTIVIKSWDAPGGAKPATVIQAEALINCTVTLFGGDQVQGGQLQNMTIDTTGGSDTQWGQPGLVRVDHGLGGTIIVAGDTVEIGTIIGGDIYNEQPQANAPSYVRVGRLIGQQASVNWGTSQFIADIEDLAGASINIGPNVAGTTITGGVVTAGDTIITESNTVINLGGASLTSSLPELTLAPNGNTSATWQQAGVNNNAQAGPGIGAVTPYLRDLSSAFLVQAVVPATYVASTPYSGLYSLAITTATTTAVKATMGVIGTLSNASGAATGTITVYDSTTGSGKTLWTGTLAAGQVLPLGMPCSNGITIVTAAADAIAVSYA